MINEKVHTKYKSFMLKAQTALATGHSSNLLGFWGAVVPPPPTSKDMQYKPGTSILGTNKDLQDEEGTSSMQMRICSTREDFISKND